MAASIVNDAPTVDIHLPGDEVATTVAPALPICGEPPAPPTGAPCGICFTETALVALSCAHKTYCRGCITQHVEATATNNGVLAPIRCPEPSCNMVLPAAEAEGLMSDVFRAKYKEWQKARAEQAVFFPSLRGFLSSLPSHVWKYLFTRSCPKCRSPVQKDGGCRHMTCTVCQTHWCWHCRTHGATFDYSHSCFPRILFANGPIGYIIYMTLTCMVIISLIAGKDALVRGLTYIVHYNPVVEYITYPLRLGANTLGAAVMYVPRHTVAWLFREGTTRGEALSFLYNLVVVPHAVLWRAADALLGYGVTAAGYMATGLKWMAGSLLRGAWDYLVYPVVSSNGFKVMAPITAAVGAIWYKLTARRR